MNLDYLASAIADTATVRTPIIPSLAVLALIASHPAASAQTVLPADVMRSCIVSPTEFNGWFETNPVQRDGKAKPADGLHFSPDSACSFYKWSEQMFLWLTSPRATGRHTFNSGDFFTVGAPGSDGKRQL